MKDSSVSSISPEILFKETKNKNKFIQANSNRYFLRVATNVPIQLKIYIYRSKTPGYFPWSTQEGDLEKDSPQTLQVMPEFSTASLKIIRNSFQDKEGTKRSRNQVVSRDDLFQFKVILCDNQTGIRKLYSSHDFDPDIPLWNSDPFYVLSCSKKAAKEWLDSCCASRVAVSNLITRWS